MSCWITQQKGRELEELVQRLEAKKEKELKLQLEKEKAKRAIRLLDAEETKDVEKEKRVELEELRKERDRIIAEEETALLELEMVENRMKGQEKQRLYASHHITLQQCTLHFAPYRNGANRMKIE
jgi:hypothetical protein